MNLDQFVDDLDALIDHIYLLYPNSNLYLLGHCWGGGLGTAYLADKSRQNKIAGWINMGGAFNNPKGDSLSMVWVKNYAQTMIESGNEIYYWEKALRWYNRNPKYTSAQLQHYSFVRKAKGYQLVEGDSLGRYPCYVKKDIISKPLQFASYYFNYYRTLKRFEISTIDLSDQLKTISIPALILWGIEDGLVPVAMGDEAYHLLGTAPLDKYLVLFSNTAHTLYYEQPVLFVRAVSDFINRYPEPNPDGVKKSVSF